MWDCVWGGLVLRDGVYDGGGGGLDGGLCVGGLV